LRKKLRLTAFFCTVAYLCQVPVSYAEIVSLPASTVSSVDLNQNLPFAPLDILPEWGKVQEIYIAEPSNPSRKFLFLIQDAHGNLSAQESIYHIVSHLVDRFAEKPVVLLEGAAGEVDTSLISKYPDPEMKMRVANRLFKEGQIDGVEQFSILEKPDLNMVGIEDPASYQENLKAVFAVFSKQEEILTDLKALDKTMAGLTPYVCGPELAEILNRIETNRETNSTLPDYLGWLRSKAMAHGAEPKSFSGLSALFSIGSKEDFERLLKTLDQRALFAEIERVEDNVLAKVMLSTKEKTFVRLFKHLRLLQRAVALKLKPSEAEYFLKFTNEFRVSAFLDFIEREKRMSPPRKRGSSALDSRLRGNDKDATESDALLPEITRFYQAAIRRDRMMKEKIELRLAENRASSAIVVTGGFHTPGIAHFLREENISYAVITPAFEQTSDFGLYKRNVLQFLSIDSETLHLPRIFDESIQMLIPAAQQPYVQYFFRNLKFELNISGAGFGTEAEDSEAIPELPEQVRSWAELIRKAKEGIVQAKLALDIAHGTPQAEQGRAAHDFDFLRWAGDELLGEAAESLQEAFEGEELTKLQAALDGYFTQLEEAAKDFKNGKKTYEEVSRMIFPIETLVQQAVNEFDYLEGALIDSPMSVLWLSTIKTWKPKANGVLESIKIRWFEFYKSLADHNLRQFSSVLRFLHDNPGFHRLLRNVAGHGYPSEEKGRKRIEQYLDLLQVEPQKLNDLLGMLKKNPSLDANILLRSLLKDSYDFIQRADGFLIAAARIVLEREDVEVDILDDPMESLTKEPLDILPATYERRGLDLAATYSMWANELEWLGGKDLKQKAQVARQRSAEILNTFRYRSHDMSPLNSTLDMIDMAFAKGRINQGLQHSQEILHLPSARRLVKELDLAVYLREFAAPFVIARLLAAHADRSQSDVSARMDEAIRYQVDPRKLTKDDIERLTQALVQSDYFFRGTTENPADIKQAERARSRRLALIGTEKSAFIDIIEYLDHEVSNPASDYGLSTKNFLERLKELESLRERLKKGELIPEGKKNSFDIFDALFPNKPVLEGDWTPRDQGIAELLTIYYSGILYWDGTSRGGERLESGTKKIHRALGHIINRGLLYETNRYQLRQQMVTMRRIKERLRSDGAIRSLKLDTRELDFLEQLLRKALIPLADPWFDQVKSLASEMDSMKQEWKGLSGKDIDEAKAFLEEYHLEGLNKIFSEDNRIFIERVIFSAFADLEAGGIKQAEEKELLRGARKRIELVLGTLHAITGVERPVVLAEGPEIATRDSAIEEVITQLSVLNLMKVSEGRQASELQRKAFAWLENIYVQASKYYAGRAHRELRRFESKKTDTAPYKNAEIVLELAKSRLEKAMEIGERGQELESELLILEKAAGDAKKGLPSVKKFDYSALSLQLSREYLYQRRLVRFRADLDRKESEREKRDIVKQALEIWQKIGRLDKEHPLTTRLRAVDEAFIPFDLRNPAIQVLDEILVEASIEKDAKIVRKAMIRFLVLERMGPEASSIAKKLDNVLIEIQEIRDKWQGEQIRKEKVREKEAEMLEILKSAEQNPRLNEFVNRIFELGHQFASLAVDLEREGRKIEVADIFPSSSMFDGFVDDQRRASILTIALAHWTEALAKGGRLFTDRELAFIFSRGLFFMDRGLHKDIVPPDELKRIAKAEPMHGKELSGEMGFYDELMEAGGLYARSGFGNEISAVEPLMTKLQTLYFGSAYVEQKVDTNRVLERLSSGFGRLQNLSNVSSNIPKAIFTSFESLPDDFSVIQKFLGQNGRWFIASQGTPEEAAKKFKVRFGIEAIPANVNFVTYANARETNTVFSPLVRRLTEVDRVRYENVLVLFGPELQSALKKFSSLVLRIYDSPGSVEALKWQTILALINVGPNHPAVKDFLAFDGGFLRVVTMEELADRLASSAQFAAAA